MEMNDEKWLKDKFDALGEERQNYVLISMKIKHFRKINRQFGRTYGDVLIRKVYNAAYEWIGSEDYLAHMYLGNYNLLLRIPEGPRDDYTFILWITDLAKKIHSVEDPHVYADVFCGFGMFILEKDSLDFYIAQHNADICRSESRERDFIIPHVEMYGTSFIEQGLFAPNYRLMLEPALKAGHIHMYLQPKVNMKTGEVTHAEALMRWIDPQLGMLPIGEYLPILEECGLANPVDMYMFKCACTWIEKWIQTYQKKINISINVSRNTFVYPFFFDEMREVFEQFTNCPKACLELELLESIILNEINLVKDVAQKIREYGFGCSLDDFGSGYSSYQVIAQAPLTMLKIDRSIFYDETSKKEQILVKHMIDTAHDLGLAVVAEGIESKSYAQFLKQLGCEYIQGFVYYRPMPVEEFEERFVRHNEKVVV